MTGGGPVGVGWFVGIRILFALEVLLAVAFAELVDFTFAVLVITTKSPT